MEEDWKEINLSSLHSRSPAAANFRHFILQDFLSSSSSKVTESSPVATELPHALLTFNSTREFHFPDNMVLSRHFRYPNTDFHSPFDQVLGNKVVPYSDTYNTSKQRQKRMIKNRESAARSRARRQAYRNELEHEVKLLREENARLKRQQAELREAAAAQISRNHRLQRTTTWPF